MSITVDTEIRKLDVGVIGTLARHLTPRNDWKTLLSAVTVPDTNMPRFTNADTELVEEAARQQQRLPAEIFLNEWSTMGRKRPTVGQVIELSMQRGLFRAADYLAVDILNGTPPARPQTGPWAAIDVSELLNNLDSDSDDDTDKQKFCNRSTAEMNNVKCSPKASEGPSNGDVRVFEMQFSEGQMQVEEDCPQKSQSDLIKFSNSVKERSDLIKFSTAKISSEINEDLVEAKNILPSFTQLGIDVSKISEVGEQTGESSSSISTSTENSASIADCSPEELYLPAMSQILPDVSEKKDSASVREDMSFDSQEIPVVVKEFLKN